MRDIASKVDNVDTLSAAEFNSYMSELENAVTKSGITLDPAGGPDTSAVMLAQAVTRAAQGGMSYEDSGAADAYVLTASGGFEAPAAYFDGQLVMFQAGNANTGASTINVSTIGVTDLKDATGTALAADAIAADAYYIAKYNLAGTEFRVVFSGSSAVPEDNFSSALLHVNNELSTGVSTGTHGSTAYVTSPLNTVKTNEIAGASLSTDTITLPAGTYYLDGFSCSQTGTTSLIDTKAKIRNTTDGADLIIGGSGRNQTGSTNYFLPVSGRFTLAGTKDIELFSRASTAGVTFGSEVNTGDVEVYSQIKIWKVA